MKRFAMLAIAGLLTATTFATIASCIEALPLSSPDNGVVMRGER